MELEAPIFHPLGRLMPRKLGEWLSLQLRYAGEKKDAEEYFGEALGLSLSFSLLLSAFDPLLFFLFPVLLLAFLGHPWSKGKKRAEKLEHGLAFALRIIGAKINAGIPLRECLEGDGEVGRLFERVRVMELRGVPLERALEESGEEYNSERVREVLMQMAFLVRRGEKGLGDSLRSLADGLLQVEREKIRAFSARAALYSMAFVVVAAIVPALYTIYTAMGVAFLEQELSPLSILVPSLLFPLLSFSIIVLMNSQVPEGLK